MHQDLRESITKGIRMRPSRETDYPTSVGFLVSFAKASSAGYCWGWCISPCGWQVWAETASPVFISEIHLVCIVCVLVLFPLQWTLFSVYLHHDFVLGQAHISDGKTYVWNHCNEIVVWASENNTASEKPLPGYAASLFLCFCSCQMENCNIYFPRDLSRGINYQLYFEEIVK